MRRVSFTWTIFYKTAESERTAAKSKDLGKKITKKAIFRTKFAKL